MGLQHTTTPAVSLIERLEDRRLLSVEPLGTMNDGHDTEHGTIIPALATSPEKVVSTVPTNGDENPYGVASVPKGFPKGGPLNPGDILISNFNNSTNTQGTGTTIVQITPNATTAGPPPVFFQGQAGLGLTTALGVLRRGFVLVGNLPTDANGNAEQGSLLILDKTGHIVKTLTDPKLFDGPWDLTVKDAGSRALVFVSNVLNGTVTRFALGLPQTGTNVKVGGETQIASGYQFRTDPAALVVGPTGLALDARRDTLYVASTGDNEVFAVKDASGRRHDGGTGTVIYNDPAHLRGPLGLALTPDGDLITSNGDAVNPDNTGATNSELIEFSPTPGPHQFIGEFQVDPGAGAAFGLAVRFGDDVITFAAVDDATNVLDIWTLDR